MQIAPASVTAPAVAMPAAAVAAVREPKGWSPGMVSPAPSSRPGGLISGGLAAWAGKREAALGVALTKTQVNTLAPFLAGQFGAAEAAVRDDLAQVRIQVGGLAHGAGNVATTVGHHIYVSDAKWATHILSWPGRKWLAHELAHTMQWRRVGDAAKVTTDAQRDREFLNRYVGAYAGYDGKVSEGGFFQALKEIARRKREQVPVGGVGGIVHDTHPMEREAAKVASAFA
jgi:hypothetical protein